MLTCIPALFTLSCSRVTLGILGIIEEAFGASLSNQQKIEGRCKLVFPFAEILKGEGNVQ
jgi:hypothetical protein